MDFVGTWLFPHGIVFVVGVILSFTPKLLLRLTARILASTPDDKASIHTCFLSAKLSTPLEWIVRAGAVAFYSREVDAPMWAIDLIDTVALILIIFLLLRVVNFVERRVCVHMEAMGVFLDARLMRPISQIIKLGITLAIGSIILEEVGYSPMSLISSLSIGGLALALASKDVVGNIFGLIVILGEKPFVLGDEIKIGSSLGVVEAIGFRSTQLRQEDGSKAMIPNQMFTSKEVVNFSDKK